MPKDAHGIELHVGDEVTIRCRVVQAGQSLHLAILLPSGKPSMESDLAVDAACVALRPASHGNGGKEGMPMG